MRKHLIRVIAGLVGAVALSAVASAAVTSVNTGFSVAPAKRDKKVRAPVAVFLSWAAPSPLSSRDAGERPRARHRCPFG